MINYNLHKINDKKTPVMKKKKQYKPPDPDKSCNYCGKTVKDGDGWYTKNKLLLCSNCKPIFIPTTLQRIRPTKVKMLESAV